MESKEFLEGYVANHINWQSIFTCPYGVFADSREAIDWCAGWEQSEQDTRDDSNYW